MELITVKDYCKREGITDAGARKKNPRELGKSIILNDITYIVEPGDPKKELIKTLRIKLRNATDKIKLLTAEKQTIIDQREHIQKLEEKIEKLEAKVEAITEKKEELYEKVIGHFSMLQIPK